MLMKELKSESAPAAERAGGTHHRRKESWAWSRASRLPRCTLQLSAPLSPTPLARGRGRPVPRAGLCRRPYPALPHRADLNKNPVEGFSAGLVEESNPFHWEIFIIGPPDSP